MYFAYQNVRMYYKIYNPDAEKTLMILHGWGAKSSFYNNISDFFILKGYRVLLLDFPPFGLSSSLPENYTVSDYAQLLNTLLQELQIYWADIICHSFGARVVSKLLDMPSGLKVEKLVITGGAGLKRRFSLRYFVRKLKFRFYKKLNLKGLYSAEKLKKFYSADYLNLSEKMKQTFNNIIKEDLEPYFVKIKIPTLLIWGEKDTETPLYMAKKLNKIIENSTLKIINKAGHYCFLTNFNEFIKYASEFLHTT